MSVFFRHIYSILNPHHFMIIYLNLRKLSHRGLNLYFSKRLLTRNFSYPYSEEHHEARSYLRARCPAWCDRILLSHSFKNIVNSEVFIHHHHSSFMNISFRLLDQPMISLVTMYVLVIIRYGFIFSSRH